MNGERREQTMYEPLAERVARCEHTEHAWRGMVFVGRSFPRSGPDEGAWGPCPPADHAPSPADPS